MRRPATRDGQRRPDAATRDAGRARPAVVEGLRLERLAGSGGEGEVWEARDERGRRRALKLIRPEALAAPDAVEERAGYLARIDHPALVRVFRSGLLDGGSLDGWGFVEMEFVDGPSLADAPGDWGHLDRLLPLAEALDLLHAGHWSDGLPLVHRDVKPANIVASPGGGLVLVDPSTLRGVDAAVLTRIGTPVFAAPEVVTGRVGPAADVYSFAVTALALVSGARGAELAELLEQVDDLDLPAGIRAGLAPVPEDRPASCRALLTDPDPVLVRDAASSGQRGPEWVLATRAPAGAPRMPHRRVWPWLAVLAALLGGPVTAWAAGALTGERLAAVAAAAAVVHLGVHAVNRRFLALAVLAPPLAWAFLLADRLALGRRRAWARALLCGPLVLAWAAPAAAVATGDPGPPAAAALTIAGLGLTVVAAGSTRAAGGTGLVLRLALLPAWLAGAVMLLAAAVVVLPPALLAGRGRQAAGLAVGTLAGAVETFRAPRAA